VPVPPRTYGASDREDCTYAVRYGVLRVQCCTVLYRAVPYRTDSACSVSIRTLLLSVPPPLPPRPSRTVLYLHPERAAQLSAAQLSAAQHREARLSVTMTPAWGGTRGLVPASRRPVQNDDSVQVHVCTVHPHIPVEKSIDYRLRLPSVPSCHFSTPNHQSSPQKTVMIAPPASPPSNPVSRRATGSRKPPQRKASHEGYPMKLRRNTAGLLSVRSIEAKPPPLGTSDRPPAEGQLGLPIGHFDTIRQVGGQAGRQADGPRE
jgi:hypothetical protein